MDIFQSPADLDFVGQASPGALFLQDIIFDSDESKYTLLISDLRLLYITVKTIFSRHKIKERQLENYKGAKIE